MYKENLHHEILRVAYDIYERNGRIEGQDLSHWLEAERIVMTLKEIAGDDGKKLISVNIPKVRSEAKEEYSKWMIKFLRKQRTKTNTGKKIEDHFNERLPNIKKITRKERNEKLGNYFVQPKN